MSTCVVNTPEEFATAVFDGMNGYPPIADMPNRKKLLLKFFDGIIAQAYAKETELRQTIGNLKTELETARQENKQMVELRELDLAYISNLEASNESLSKQKSTLAWVAALYHDRFIDLTLTS